MSDDEDNIVKLVIHNEQKHLPTAFHKYKDALWTISIKRNADGVGKYLHVKCSSVEQHPYWTCRFSASIDLTAEDGEKKEIYEHKDFSNYTKVASILKLEDNISGVELYLYDNDLQVYNFTKTDLFNESMDNITDFKLIVEGQTLYVCKKILATYSQYFYKLLYKQDKTLTEYSTDTESCNIFRVFLGLLYNQNNFLTDENVSSVSYLSNDFSAKHCLEECEKFLIKSDEEPDSKLSIAQRNNFKKLNHHILSSVKTVDDYIKLTESLKYNVLDNEIKLALFDKLTEIQYGRGISSPTSCQFKQRTFKFTDKIRHLTDVALLVGGKKFYVSKQLMAYKSSYFHALFYSDFEEKTKDVIELKGIGADEFDIFLQFVHHMSQILDRDNFQDVLELSQMYGTEVVTKRCENFIRNEKYMTDVSKILLAERYNLPQIFDEVASKIKTQDDYINLSKMENFDKLSMETLGKISMKLLS